MRSEFGGHSAFVTHIPNAADAREEAVINPPPKPRAPSPRAFSNGGSSAVGGEVDHPFGAPHNPSVDLAANIYEIREQWRRRQNWHRAEKSLTLQARALCRR